MRMTQLILVLASAIALAGCPKRVTTVPEGAGASAGSQGAATTGAGSGAAQTGEQLTAEQVALRELERLGMIIYFDYDRAEIKPEYVSVVAAHARFLNGNASRKTRLEGHADERGSREYNIGLGERRAQAVRRALLLQGVTDAQITTVSYGEERAAAAGNDEAAYSRNRRVQIGYGQ
jgi:peptidoglycan-associated lipoprotein